MHSDSTDRSPRRNRHFGALALTLIVLACALPSLTRADAPAADPAQARDILERADRIRFPAEAFQVDVAITTSAPDADTDERAYRILSKGNAKTLVLTTAPAI